MKKIIYLSILVVFMLVAISFATAANTKTAKSIEKKESPLYKIRTNGAIGKNIDVIKTKFMENRLFFIPLAIKNKEKEMQSLPSGIPTCFYTCPWATCGKFCLLSLMIC